MWNTEVKSDQFHHNLSFSYRLSSVLGIFEWQNGKISPPFKELMT